MVKVEVRVISQQSRKAKKLEKARNGSRPKRLKFSKEIQHSPANTLTGLDL